MTTAQERLAKIINEDNIIERIQKNEDDIALLKKLGISTGSEDSSDWKDAGYPWTYSSVDGSTGVVAISGDMLERLSLKMKVRYEQQQSLTMYWTFDTNSNSSVGSHNGTDTSMTYTSGKFSNAATFNGTTSKIVFTDHANFKPTGEYTFGLWFKTNASGTDKQLFQSFSQNTNIAGILLKINTSNVLRFLSGSNTGTTSGIHFSEFNGTTSITDNAWHRVVVSYRNNYVQIYLDNKLEMAGYCIAPAYAATNYVRVGCRNSTGSDVDFMSGQIDDLFFINGYALDQILTLDKYAANEAQGINDFTVTKYGVITAIGDFTSGESLVTFWGGTDYSLTNATISNPAHSPYAAPYGFPLNDEKWSVIVSDFAGNTYTRLAAAGITANNYYSGNSFTPSIPTITLPIGDWDWMLSAQVQINITLGAAGNVSIRFAFSEAANTIPTDLRALSVLLVTFTAIANVLRYIPVLRGKKYLTAKTTFYPALSTGSTNPTSIDMISPFTFRARLIFP